MFLEIAAALAALSVGASLGVFLVASEGASFSYRMPRLSRVQWFGPAEARASAADRVARPDVEVVSDSLLWRYAEHDGARVETFCALCDGPLEVVEGTAFRCEPCGLRSRLPGDLSLREAQARAEVALRERASRSALA